METLVAILAALFSLHAVRSDKGLRCTNDYLSTVSCSWSRSPADPGADCWITGVKKVFVRGKPQMMIKSCQVTRRENSPPGCSLTFENREFSSWEKMPNISVKCNGTLMDAIFAYVPVNHIKMHPPPAPHIRSTANGTWILWSPGPVSIYLTNFDIEAQLKKKEGSWERANLLSINQRERMIPIKEPKGDVQLRLRVKPVNKGISQWSDWSPATSWTGPPDQVEASEDKESWLHQGGVTTVGLLLPVGLVVCALLLVYGCKTRGLLKEKPIPSPSEYLTVHQGNLKDWLNPLRGSGLFFECQPCEQISRVEVCEDGDALPSPSPPTGTTGVLLHLQDLSSGGSQTSGVAGNSSSSSCFSNMGYFMSSSSEGSAHATSKVAYFAYQDDSCALQPFIFSSRSTSKAHWDLKKEQHSPDSGFCTGKEDELDIDLYGEEDVEDLSSHLLTFHLPLQRFPLPCPPGSPGPPGPPHPVGVMPVDSDIQQAESSAAAEHVVPGAACRPSSMPVEPRRTGYLTLKDLQTTFSNKSI